MGGSLAPFIKFVFETLKEMVDPDLKSPRTIDSYHYNVSQPDDLDKLETAVSYHNYYHYMDRKACANTSDVQKVQGDLAADMYRRAEKLDQPVLISEFGQAECYCPAAQAIQNQGVGWILWELILSHDEFGSFQGLVYANGTARSESEVDCIRALATPSGRVGAANLNSVARDEEEQIVVV